MIKLKQYSPVPTLSLEGIADKLSTFEHLNIGLEAHPELFGLEAIDVKGTLVKVKEVIVAMFKAIADFFKNLWQKLFGKEVEQQILSLENKISEVEKTEVETTEEEQTAIKELVKENNNPSTDPVVPEGLPKNLYTQLIKAHDAFYNVGPMVFQNDHVKDTEYFNHLAPLVLDLIKTHRVEAENYLNDSAYTQDQYTDKIVSSSSYRQLQDLLTKAEIEVSGLDYQTAFYALNEKAKHYTKTPYFALDVNQNSVYKAKLGELKSGLKHMRETAKNDSDLRTRAQQQQATFDKLIKQIDDQDSVAKARVVGKAITQLVQATLLILRLRQLAFNSNIAFIEAVVSVMQHHSFKKGK